MKNRLHPYKLVLGERANMVLIAIVQRSHIEPEHLLRAICETDLYNTTADDALVECFMEDAQLVKDKGTLAGKYWDREPNRHDGLEVDYSDAQEEAPDDVPTYQSPATKPIRRTERGKYAVTVEFTETAYAGLLLMKAYDKRASLEEVVLHSMAGEVACTFEAISEDWLQEQFGIEE